MPATAYLFIYLQYNELQIHSNISYKLFLCHQDSIDTYEKSHVYFLAAITHIRITIFHTQTFHNPSTSLIFYIMRSCDIMKRIFF